MKIEVIQRSSPMTAHPICPAELAFVAAHLQLRFEGEQEGFLHLPATWLFTDLDPQSPALGTTFSIVSGADADALRDKAFSKRREFTSKKEAA